jgi:hypothetical protein
MHAVIAYESMFGNTRMVAEAIGVGLAATCSVDVLRMSELDAGRLAAADLLVVGGPTHAWGMSRPNTRTTASAQADKAGSSLSLEPHATAPGLREWFESPVSAPGAAGSIGSVRSTALTKAAAFDTRMQLPRLLTGRASVKLVHALRRRGYDVIASPASFLVGRKSTALVAGELERAREWGATLSAP